MLRRNAIALLIASLIWLPALCTSARAQNVTTFVGGLGGPTDMTWDTAGNMYIAANDAVGNSEILKVDPSGSSVIVFAAGDFLDIWGLAMSSSGDLYAADRAVSRVGAGKIWKITPAGVKSVFATGFTDALFIKFDSVGDLYVSEWGPRNLKRVSPAGSVSIYAGTLGPVLDQCGDFEIMPNGDIYIGVGPNLKLIGAGGGPVTTVASGLGSIVGLRRNGDDSFFFGRGHEIWTISSGPVRTASKWSGPGLGCTDGPRATANFSFPAGIHAFHDRLYIAERSGCKSIRTIDLAGVPVSNHRSSWGEVKAFYR